MEAIPTAGIVVLKGSQVLLVRHLDQASHLTGSYGLPAGKLEAGETEKQAAARELLEETGLRVEEHELFKIPKLWLTDIRQKDGIKRFSFTAFVARVFKGDLRVSNKTVPEWVDIELIKRLNTIGETEETARLGKELFEKL